MRPQRLETSTDYRPALLWLMGDLGQARAADAIAEFVRRLGDLIPSEHRELNKSGYVKWENYVRWARQALVNAGLVGSGGYGVWTITEAGQKWLQDHPDGGKRELVELIRGSKAAKKDKSTPSQRTPQLTTKQSIKISGETFVLSLTDVLTKVRRALADGLPPEAKRFIHWYLLVDDEPLSVKWVMALVTGLPTDRFTTYQARNQLRKLGLEAQSADKLEAVGRPTSDVEPQLAGLSREAFYRAVLAHLEGKLPPSVYNRRLNPQTNYLQLVCPAPGTHYELRLLKSYTEIAVHFEGRRERNLSLLDQFRPQVETLQEQLGETVYAEPWGKNWARVYRRRPPIQLDAPTAEALADDWLRFIEITLPVIEKAVADLGLRVRPGRSPTTVKEKHLDRPKAILTQTVRDIRAYLNGDQALFPSDDKLCDWIQFCYTFELFAEATDLFKLVRPDAVHPWLYERTQKLARACGLRK